jgi:hypothetical protein
MLDMKNVYYCDTDSVFTTKKPSNQFLDQNILGIVERRNKYT